MNTHIKLFIKLIKESFRDLLPIIVVISMFQLLILQQIPENTVSVIIGLSIVLFGLAIFILGLEIGIFPLGEGLAHEFAKKGSIFWLLLFAFLIGFSTTVAEPALIAIADKAAAISNGKIDAFFLRLTVALSVGFAIALGVFRIILGHPIHWYIIVGYIIVVLITFFAPPEIVGIAYDSGGVTTSTVTVPLVTALGIGLASSIKGRNPVIDGFGLIAFASLTPMIFVQIYGILALGVGGDASQVQPPLPSQELAPHEVTYSEHKPHWLVEIVFGLFAVIKDLIPILAVIFFFQYVIIKRPIPHLKLISLGFIYVIIGLYAFLVGLEMGLFPLGETMALQLTQTGNYWLIYLFGFLIGFSTTMAEPALIAVALKAKEVSKGKINDFLLRTFVAIGVAIGIALGCYRIL